MNAGLAVTKTLLIRHRVGLPVVAGYMALSAIVFLTWRKSGIALPISIVLLIGLAICGFYLTSVFLHTDADVATPGSTYPPHYFTLPVKTTVLVIWPVLVSLICVGGGTMLMCMALAKAGFDIDVYSATLLSVSSLTALQAIFWYPLGIPYSKLVLTLAMIGVLIAVTFASSIFEWPNAVRMVSFLVISLVSVWVTAIGVGRARIGESATRQIRFRERTDKRKKLSLKPRFLNAEKAQLWYEWRQHGTTLPILTAIVTGLFFIPYGWSNTLSPVYALKLPDSNVLPTVPTFILVYYPVLLMLMPVYSWAIGCGAKRTDLKRGERTFQLFFGTRPMRDESMIWSKLKVASLSTLAAWGVLVIGTIPILFVKCGHYLPVNYQTGQSERPDRLYIDGLPLYQTLAPYMTKEALVFIASIIFVALFFTLRNYIIGFWSEVSGRLLFKYFQPAVGAVVVGATIAWATTWRKSPPIEDFVMVFAALASLKLVLSVVLAFQNYKSGLMQARSLMLLALVYVSLTAALSYFGNIAFGPFVAAFGWDKLSGLIFVILLSICYVPLLRILISVPALSLNRHR